MVSTDVWAFANAFHEDIGLDVALLFPPWLENGLGPCHAVWSERIMALFSGTCGQICPAAIPAGLFQHGTLFYCTQATRGRRSRLVNRALSPFQRQITGRMLIRSHLEIISLLLLKYSWMSIFSVVRTEWTCGEWRLYLQHALLLFLMPSCVYYFFSHIACGWPWAVSLPVTVINWALRENHYFNMN